MTKNSEESGYQNLKETSRTKLNLEPVKSVMVSSYEQSRSYVTK